jgi:hypothetical protein
MALWWIGNVVLIGVVLPVVIVLLKGVLQAGMAVRRQCDAIAGVGATMVQDLNPVIELVTTESFISSTTAGLAAYGGALDRIL